MSNTIHELLTQDGSHTLFSEQFQATYHSKFGSIQESNHVFIEQGLVPLLQQKKELAIVEMGFGSGLNVLLAHLKASEMDAIIHYETIEQFPIAQQQAEQLNYCELLNKPDWQTTFLDYHRSEWNKELAFPNFYLTKKRMALEEWQPNRKFDVVFYDAFAPETQPELWTVEVFEKLRNCMNPNAVLTTYCAKGQVKRNFRTAGFLVETLQGPPGKREMVRCLVV